MPYAGGSSAIYNQWKSYFDFPISIQAIELAGRGRRIYDPLYNNIDEAIDDIMNIIRPEIQQQQQQDYVFFGHSMGGLLAYELTRKIQQEQLPLPKQVFISGASAPNISKDRKKYNSLPMDEFREEVLNLGGTPKEIFEYPELAELFLPILKNDFKLVETYPYGGKKETLQVDISVFLGRSDDLAGEEGWSELTNKQYDIHNFDGGHFFLNEKIKEVINTIKTTLTCKSPERLDNY